MTERNLKRICEAEDLLTQVWWDMRHMGEDTGTAYETLTTALDYIDDLKRMVESNGEED